ncbi:Ig-like domain (group 3) [Acetitomaculum ruminis DSM 5522]|uniref:Ig-like domain (Group 3) n=1 Tax=Acetitomaculum ruminis DSM 5522 TaxID=1120918 RepID=A0A1I0WEN7_9FIRM|nr:bacterial Ig-like domain-containing protein [Acetitomaculum ruminis]SFA87219.1 Ig-like domain (group 3) [Acetitomaculum ruminis DSM 5522]
MSYYKISDTTLKNIANALRAKTGSDALMKVSEMPDAIASIKNSDLKVGIKYNFNNNVPGDASGTIYVCSIDINLTDISLRWADNEGDLQEYTNINVEAFNVEFMEREAYIYMSEINLIPTAATRVIALVDGAVVGSFTIPVAKRLTSSVLGNHVGDVALLSDVHIGYDTSVEDLTKILSYARTIGADAVCIAGDITQQGTQAYLNNWQSARDNARGSLAVYSCTGNHEAYNDNCLIVQGQSIRAYLDTDSTSDTLPYFYKVINGDVYVFVSCFDGDVKQSRDNVMYTTAQLDWLEDVLETYRNQRVFLFAHVPPNKWAMSNNGFGIANGAYSFDVWGTSSGVLADRTRFLSLMEHYKNVIWFSGHSHIKWEYQESASMKNLNYARYNNGARLIHLSSLTVPRDLIDSDNDGLKDDSVTDYIYAESQAMIMEVYENGILLKGRDFIVDKFISIAQFYLDTAPVTVPAKEVVTLTGIEAVKTKTSYSTGESLNTNDITVTAYYSNNTSKIVTAMINTSNVDMNIQGTYQITISYTENGTTLTDTISITVEDAPVITLSSITATKTKTQYNTNESLNTDDITITAHYSDGSSQVVQGTVDTSNANMAAAGTYTITVSYSEDGITKTANITITVTSASVEPNPPSGEYVEIPLTWHNGRVDGVTGEIDDKAKYSYTDAVSVSNVSMVKATVQTNICTEYYLQLVWFNANNEMIRYSEDDRATTTTGEIVTVEMAVPSGASYLRINMKHGTTSQYYAQARSNTQLFVK